MARSSLSVNAAIRRFATSSEPSDSRSELSADAPWQTEATTPPRSYTWAAGLDNWALPGKSHIVPCPPTK
ncbi:hypothetical protein ABT246_34305 [Streptomyces sp. NPDC001553]|uniref:hypothetical protein n=1 Tax=Streptomyces sp. NPDC001553 TaxID=3154385 RepID=UPI0033334D42